MDREAFDRHLETLREYFPETLRGREQEINAAILLEIVWMIDQVNTTIEDVVAELEGIRSEVASK